MLDGVMNIAKTASDVIPLPDIPIPDIPLIPL
jgi:hypothetical protein